MITVARRMTKADHDRRNAERKALLAQLDAFADEHDDDAIMLAKIDAWSDRYSERNATLIVMQAPEATDVRGYRAWRAEGRQVRRGEAGIRILAPAGKRDAAEPSEDNPEGTSARQFFKLISVFDVAQTDAMAPAVSA